MSKWKLWFYFVTSVGAALLLHGIDGAWPRTYEYLNLISAGMYLREIMGTRTC